mmetsp:Transcript_8390/g.25216  ORF Transcript_8390/g.25216 Transcript_8390/m.25216 type:complete len:697 (+) Transcript_8390:32-2122(+)
MFYANSAVDTLLDKLESNSNDEQITLHQFLDESDIISELRTSNTRLADYLGTDENLRALVGYCTGKWESKEDKTLDSEKRQIFAVRSSEILATKLPQISGNLAVKPELLETLFSVLENTDAGELDIVTAANITRVMVAMVRCQNAEVLQLALSRQNFFASLYKHISISPVAELLVRLLDGPETDQEILPPRGEALQLLQRGDILNRLVDLFVESAKSTAIPERVKEETVLNISTVIIGIALRILELAKKFVSVPVSLNPYSNGKVIARMIDAGLQEYQSSGGENCTALICALNVASELLTTEANERVKVSSDSYNRPSGRALTSMISMSQVGYNGFGHNEHDNSEDTEMEEKIPIMSTEPLEIEVRTCFEPLVKTLKQDAPKKAIINAAGRIEEPLGWTRLKIIDFLIACLKRGCEDTVQTLDDNDVPDILLDLFFKYEWNSMLHHMVASAIVHALESDAEVAQTAWMRVDIVKRLIAKWNEEKVEREKSDERQEYRSGGHLGHIIMLAASLESFLERNSDRKSIFANEEELSMFEEFCNTHLEEAKQRQCKHLGGVPPGTSARSECSDVVEENTDVFDFESMSNELPPGLQPKMHGRDDSDEDDEVEVVDTSLDSDEITGPAEMPRNGSNGNGSSDGDDWEPFEADTAGENNAVIENDALAEHGAIGENNTAGEKDVKYSGSKEATEEAATTVDT